MSERPPHLDITAVRVVKVCPRLTALQKLVFVEVHHLESIAFGKDDSRGCYASASVLGERLGVPSESVERVRRELRAMGTGSDVPEDGIGGRGLQSLQRCLPSTVRQ